MCVCVCVCVCVPRNIVTFNANLQAVDVKVTAHKTITLCSVYLPFRNHFNFNCNPKDLQHVTDRTGTGTGKRYLRVYIHIRFRHARSRAQPLAWPVTLSAAGASLTNFHLLLF